MIKWELDMTGSASWKPAGFDILSVVIIESKNKWNPLTALSKMYENWWAVYRFLKNLMNTYECMQQVLYKGEG